MLRAWGTGVQMRAHAGDEVMASRDSVTSLVAEEGRVLRVADI